MSEQGREGGRERGTGGRREGRTQGREGGREEPERESSLSLFVSIAPSMCFALPTYLFLHISVASLSPSLSFSLSI